MKAVSRYVSRKWTRDLSSKRAAGCRGIVWVNG